MLSLKTEHGSCGFYMSWFHRCYRVSEHGWNWHVTPDGKHLVDQDSYFWQCLEAIARKLNTMIVQERQKISQRAKHRG